MKKIFIAIFTILLFIQTSTAAFAKAKTTSSVNTNTTISESAENSLNCKQALTQNKPIVVLYTADYCFYCKRFKPVFYHLSHHLSDEFSFVLYDITKKQQPSICDSIDLNSIPTMYIINPKNNNAYIVPDKYYSNPVLLKSKLEEYYKNLK